MTFMVCGTTFMVCGTTFMVCGTTFMVCGTTGETAEDFESDLLHQEILEK